MKSEVTGILMFRAVPESALELAAGEPVLRTCTGSMGPLWAPIVGRVWLTDRRLSFQAGWRNFTRITNSFAFSDITSVDRSTQNADSPASVFRRPLVIITAQGRRSFQVDDAGAWATAVEQAHAGSRPGPPNRTGDLAGRIAALEQVGSLWRSGVLSQVEFEAEKAKVLAAWAAQGACA